MDNRHSPPLEDAVPSPELRERVLGLCRREMAARAAAGRRRQWQWRWSVAAGVVGLLLLNTVEEGRSTARIERLMSGPAHVVRAPQPSSPHLGSLRLRRILLATLLRDPDAL